jgi:glycerate 2-kinase
MRVLIAPNSMKGSIDASGFADAVEAGLSEVGITDVIKLPLADGGDGTAKVLSAYYKAEFMPVTVFDPLQRMIESGYYYDKQRTAIIEMADASGLRLLSPSEYSAINTTSYGTGQLIKSAIENGARTIILGLGGSATVDGGMGALMSLGVKFFDREGEIAEGKGAAMGNVLYIDLSEARRLLNDTRLFLLSDVKNPLLGKFGAVRVFGPQKGANSHEIEMLEKNMSLFAGALFQTTGIDSAIIPDGGAAGGVAASFHSLLGAELIDGATFIMKKAGFYKLIDEVDILITGEGKIDDSTFMGKVPGEVLKIGIEMGKPVYAICGSNNLSDNGGFEAIYSLINKEIEEIEAMGNTSLLIKETAHNLANKIQAIYG